MIYRYKLDSVAYISAAESTGVSSTTFTAFSTDCNLSSRVAPIGASVRSNLDGSSSWELLQELMGAPNGSSQVALNGSS